MMAETIHIGRKISRIREIRGIKQDYLVIEMGVSQQTISKIEQSETVEDETLGKVAKALGVRPQAIKSFTEDAIINYFHDQSYFNYQCTFNPLDNVMELYKRLLQAERENMQLSVELFCTNGNNDSFLAREVSFYLLTFVLYI